MAIEVPQNEEISGGQKNGGRIHRGRVNREAYTLGNESEEKLLKEMLTPT